MEERQPLESRSLTHTSQEPEAQAWAQIGTAAAAAAAATELSAAKTEPTRTIPTSLDASIDSVPFSSSISGGEVLSGVEKDDDTNSDFQLHVDEDAEPFQEVDGVDAEENEATAEQGESSTVESADKEGENGKKEGGESEEAVRTNSLDPNKIRARIFVGQLKTESGLLKKKDIEKAFSKFGTIEGISLQHGYGFIQYQDEDSAKMAIREMHGNTDLGSKIVVDKPVALKKLLGEKTGVPKPWPLDERNPRDRAIMDEWDYLRERDMRERELRDRYARLEDLERLYHRGGGGGDHLPPPPPPPPRRDPYYHERGSRSRQYPPAAGHMDAMDRYERMRYAELEHARGRYQERFYPSPPPPPAHPAAYGYERPRDDPYDRRGPREFDRYEMPFSRRM